MARSKHTCCGGVAHSWLRSSGQEGTRPPRRMWRAHFARTFLWRGWPFGFAPFYPAQGRQVRIAPFRHQEQRDAGLKARRNMKQKARQETRQGAKALTSVPGRDAAGFPNVAADFVGGRAAAPTQNDQNGRILGCATAIQKDAGLKARRYMKRNPQIRGKIRRDATEAPRDA